MLKTTLFSSHPPGPGGNFTSPLESAKTASLPGMRLSPGLFPRRSDPQRALEVRITEGLFRSPRSVL